MTVTGPVNSSELGVTLPHEHLLLDLTCLWHPPLRADQEHLVDAIPSLENLGELRADPYVSCPNLRLDEPEIALQEMLMYRRAGGRTMVEGIGPQPAHLLRTVVPRLWRRGVDDETLHRILIDNPARLLGRASIV